MYQLRAMYPKYQHFVLRIEHLSHKGTFEESNEFQIRRTKIIQLRQFQREYSTKYPYFTKSIYAKGSLDVSLDISTETFRLSLHFWSFCSYSWYDFFFAIFSNRLSYWFFVETQKHFSHYQHHICMSCNTYIDYSMFYESMKTGRYEYNGHDTDKIIKVQQIYKLFEFY